MSTRVTRERILDAAEEIMLERSFHSVGLNQILKAVGVPKGSFYHYFDSKEQFGVEMLKHYVAATSEAKREGLLVREEEPHPVHRLVAYLERAVTALEETPGRFPCLVLKLASEIADHCEPMRRELARGLEEWIAIFREVLDEARKAGLLPGDLDTMAEAQMIYDLWAGSVQRSVVNRSAEPVRRAVAQIRSRLAAPGE